METVVYTHCMIISIYLFSLSFSLLYYKVASRVSFCSGTRPQNGISPNLDWLPATFLPMIPRCYESSWRHHRVSLPCPLAFDLLDILPAFLRLVQGAFDVTTSVFFHRCWSLESAVFTKSNKEKNHYKHVMGSMVFVKFIYPTNIQYHGEQRKDKKENKIVEKEEVCNFWYE